MSIAYQKCRNVLCGNTEALAGFGVAGLSALGFILLMRKPGVARAGDQETP